MNQTNNKARFSLSGTYKYKVAIILSCAGGHDSKYLRSCKLLALTYNTN
jgi:hypothetical protein